MIDPETDEMGWVDRLIVLDGGRVALSGTPAELWDAGQARSPRRQGIHPGPLGRRPRSPGALAGCARRRRRDPGRRLAGGRWRRRTLAGSRTLGAGGEVLLEVEGLTHRYPDGTEALAGVSCTIRRGEFVAILGQNGSGKTTLVKHLNGILAATTGEIRLLGQSLPGSRPHV